MFDLFFILKYNSQSSGGYCMKLSYKILFSLILFITLGYLFFVPEYSVKGLFEKNNPNLVYFTSIHDIQKIGMVEENSLSLIDSQNLEFNISLSIPGDQYSFYVDIQNDNYFPVTVEILSSELDELSKQYLNYIVLSDKKVLESNDRMTVQVIVEFKPEITELPECDIVTHFNTQIVATQA